MILDLDDIDPFQLEDPDLSDADLIGQAYERIENGDIEEHIVSLLYALIELIQSLKEPENHTDHRKRLAHLIGPEFVMLDPFKDFTEEELDRLYDEQYGEKPTVIDTGNYSIIDDDGNIVSTAEEGETADLDVE